MYKYFMSFTTFHELARAAERIKKMANRDIEMEHPNA